MLLSFSLAHHYCLSVSVANYQPVHNLKAAVVNSSNIFLTWEKPVDITDPSVIKVCSCSQSNIGAILSCVSKGKNYGFAYTLVDLERFSLTRALQGFFLNGQICFWWMSIICFYDNSLERVLNENNLAVNLAISEMIKKIGKFQPRLDDFVYF